MSECCSVTCADKPKTVKPHCPACGHKGSAVGVKTILQHIRDPWLYSLTEEAHYFCAQTQCDVVYFAAAAKPIKKSALRTTVGLKEKSNEALICYCFGVTRAQANIRIKEFVIKQTKIGMCACETANPSGKCCLKDFPTEES